MTSWEEALSRSACGVGQVSEPLWFLNSSLERRMKQCMVIVS